LSTTGVRFVNLVGIVFSVAFKAMMHHRGAPAVQYRGDADAGAEMPGAATIVSIVSAEAKNSKP
jgi:hypothetical protein